MKSILAGNGGGCTETNCWICDTGGFHCNKPNEPEEGPEPVPGDGELPGDGCSWGICPQCCVN